MIFTFIGHKAGFGRKYRRCLICNVIRELLICERLTVFYGNTLSITIPFTTDNSIHVSLSEDTKLGQNCPLIGYCCLAPHTTWSRVLGVARHSSRNNWWTECKNGHNYPVIPIPMASVKWLCSSSHQKMEITFPPLEFGLGLWLIWPVEYNGSDSKLVLGKASRATRK